jgi:hypothetical protein
MFRCPSLREAGELSGEDTKSAYARGKEAGEQNACRVLALRLLLG